MAIAAGVNLILSHEFMSTMSMMRYESRFQRQNYPLTRADFSHRTDAATRLAKKPMATRAVRPLPASY